MINEPPEFNFGFRDAYTPLSDSPASKRLHHSYPGGLIEHTISVTRLGLSLCDILEDVYHAKPNRDVVIASLVLHDLFKFYTYGVSPRGRYFTSRIGEHIDHLSLVSAEIYKRKFPVDVIHAVLASHGEHGPMRPRTLEALIVHLADQADAELNGQILDAARYIVSVSVDSYLQEEALATIDPFEIVRARQKGGYEGVRRLVDARMKVKAKKE
jgi:7,8-dihydroneopterin 2',3'-cyclic phosphate phosphodiesterase